MQPDADEYREWLTHPVTEWIMGLCERRAEEMKGKWANLVWQEGIIDPSALTEARTRADCYRAIPDSTFEDWKAIDDSED